MIRFAIVGAGWRTEFFLRIAAALPERFHVTGVLARSPQKAERLRRLFGVATVESVDALLAEKPDFVVVSVSWADQPVLIAELAGRRVAVLSETPPAPDVAGLTALWRLVEGGARVQVAEQYAFQPLHAARLAVVASGKLGEIVQAQVSAAHGYHGLNLLRRLLGVGFANATVHATRIASPQQAWPGRDLAPQEARLATDNQLVAWLRFDDGRFGVFDFADSQYFSRIRTPRILVRGAHGEIHDESVRWLTDPNTPLVCDLTRHDTGHGGNLEGWHHVGVTLGAEWVYRNPFAPARLSDDETAIATCLEGMAGYVGGAPGFCGIDEAGQDRYLDICLAEAARTGEPLRTETQAWAT